MKKAICFLFAAMLVFSASACKNTKNVNSDSSSTSVVISTESNTTSNDSTKNVDKKTAETEDITKEEKNGVSAGNTKQNTTSTGNKNTVNSNPNNSSSYFSTTNKHIHNFSQATCTEPQKCECGATEGKALGHSWCEATCNSPQICSVCKITQGPVGTHIIENGVCKFCKQAIIISPENLDTSKTYVHFLEDYPFVFEGTYYENVIIVDFIGFGRDFHGSIGQRGLYSSNKYETSCLTDSIKYNGKDYYHIGIGGVGSSTTYEIKDNNIIIRDFDEPTSYAILNLLSDRTIKLIYKTDNFYGNWRTQIGWIYSPINKKLP